MGNLISSSVLDVPFVFQLYEKQVIGQVGSVPRIAASLLGEEFPDREALTGQRCNGETALL